MRKLHTPTVVPTADGDLDALGDVPLLAQIYRLCQEHAPDMEENFDIVRRMSVSDQEALKRDSCKMKKNSGAGQGALLVQVRRL